MSVSYVNVKFLRKRNALFVTFCFVVSLLFVVSVLFSRIAKEDIAMEKFASTKIFMKTCDTPNLPETGKYGSYNSVGIRDELLQVRIS